MHLFCSTALVPETGAPKVLHISLRSLLRSVLIRDSTAGFWCNNRCPPEAIFPCKLTPQRYLWSRVKPAAESGSALVVAKSIKVDIIGSYIGVRIVRVDVRSFGSRSVKGGVWRVE